MCDNSTMGWGSLAIQGAGVLLGTGASYEQSAAAKASYQYQAQIDRNNAIIAEYQAADAIERGRLAEQRLRREARQLKGTQAATMAARGIDLDYGTAVDIFAGTDVVAAEDVYTLRTNAEREAWGYRVEAANRRSNANLYESRASQESPGLAAASTLLGGATQVADRWYRYRTESVT